MGRNVYILSYPVDTHTPAARANTFVVLRAADLALDEHLGFFTIEYATLMGGTPPEWSTKPYFPERDTERLAHEGMGGIAILTIHLYTSRPAADAAVAAQSTMAHPFVYDAREVAARLRPISQ